MSEKPTILVVDDDTLLLRTLERTLADEGYSIITAGNGLEALIVLEETAVNLIIADVSMPGMNGYQLLNETRKIPRFVTLPFLFMSARTMDSDIRYALELGADQYLPKPVNLEDLKAMVRGRLRHAKQVSQFLEKDPSPLQSSDVIDVGRLHIHLDQHQVMFADKTINLSVTEFKLLVCLANNHNTIVSPQDIVKETHNLDTDSVEASNLVRPLIRSLRRRLGYQTGDPGCIENIRGVGYRLIPPTS